MYKEKFGTKDQLTFTNESEYYELLGYLAKSDGSVKLVWEDNDDQGAWGKEGRIQLFENPPQTLSANLMLTAGVGNVLHRINCNEFVENIITHNAFVYGSSQDRVAIMATIPQEYQSDFTRGTML